MFKTVKFLHCGDIHLDAPFTSLGGAEKASARRQDLKDAFQNIINMAKDENVELLLISGDLYEHNYVRKSTISHINDLFKQIQDVKVFIVPGNHDPFVPNSFYKNFKWSENVHILTNDNPYINLDDIKVCVYGIGFNNFYEDKELSYNIKPVDDGYINILLIHGTVDMNFKLSQYNPMDSEKLAGIGMDYVALGHFHNRIDDIGGAGTIYNPGSPEPLGFDEPGGHGVFIGKLLKDNDDKSKLEIEFRKLGKRYYKGVEVDISSCCTNEQIIEMLEGSAIKAVMDGSALGDIKDGLFTFTLRGYVEKEFKIDIPLIQSYFSDKMFFIKIKDETQIDYNFDEIMKEVGLRGLFVSKIYTKIKMTKDEYEKKLLIKALYYGLEALETGKIEIS